jgi:hypothetical protein
MGTKNRPAAYDCYANALPDEPMFVLLARDRQAPATVREWANRRENALRTSDATCTAAEVYAEIDQIAEARQCADAMQAWRAAQRPDEAAGYRSGARLNCGCWWAAPPLTSVGDEAEDGCAFHGDGVTVVAVNVSAGPGDDSVSEFIRG